jgi:transposase
VKSYAGRKNISYSGFVTPSDGYLFVAKPQWFTWKTTIESFRQFIVSYRIDQGKRIVLVLDNAPWHRKAKRLIESEPEYADIRKKLSFVSLPPYSPDLNPIEQVWRITRREKTHNKFWQRLDGLASTLDTWFATFAQPNEKLRSLCSFKSKRIS